MTTKATTTKKKKLVLHTLPPIPNAYSWTPFGLKVESFLRINKIPYEKCYTSTFGNNGTIPYMRIIDENRNEKQNNFKEIPDSNQIITSLLDDTDFDTSSCEENLTKVQKAITHSCLRMLEEHTAQVGFYYKYNKNMNKFCEVTELRETTFMADKSISGYIGFICFKVFMVSAWGEKAKARGFVRYGSPNIVWAMSCDDLQALEDLFAVTKDRAYFFGRSQPGVLDCAVFGHVAQFLYIDMDFPQKFYLQEKCPGLLRFMENFKQTYFPDWEKLCQRQPNEALSSSCHSKLLAHKKNKERIVAGAGMTNLVVLGAGVALTAVGLIASHKFIQETFSSS